MYRPSLGTRGETRRAAAEAETAIVGRVRPWTRNAAEPCPLAPHVLVPRWVRAPDPPAPPPKALTPGDPHNELLGEPAEQALAPAPSEEGVAELQDDLQAQVPLPDGNATEVGRSSNQDRDGTTGTLQFPEDLQDGVPLNGPSAMDITPADGEAAEPAIDRQGEAATPAAADQAAVPMDSSQEVAMNAEELGSSVDPDTFSYSMVSHREPVGADATSGNVALATFSVMETDEAEMTHPDTTEVHIPSDLAGSSNGTDPQPSSVLPEYVAQLDSDSSRRDPAITSDHQIPENPVQPVSALASSAETCSAVAGVAPVSILYPSTSSKDEPVADGDQTHSPEHLDGTLLESFDDMQSKLPDVENATVQSSLPAHSPASVGAEPGVEPPAIENSAAQTAEVESCLKNDKAGEALDAPSGELLKSDSSVPTGFVESLETVIDPAHLASMESKQGSNPGQANPLLDPFPSETEADPALTSVTLVDQKNIDSKLIGGNLPDD
jgi:hypothetical protein